jgi:hypothetical protein
MSLFGRRPRRRLPADILAQLEQLGRAAYDPSSTEAPWQLTVAMYQLAQEDRDGFLGELAMVSLPAGGWPGYGAMKLVMDILEPKPDQPDFNAIVLAGLEFLRSHGVPTSRLSPNEMDQWRRLRVDDTPWRRIPDALLLGRSRIGTLLPVARADPLTLAGGAAPQPGAAPSPRDPMPTRSRRPTHVRIRERKL